MEVIRNQIANLCERVCKLEDNMDNIEESVNEIGNSLASGSERMKGIEGRTERIGSDVKRLLWLAVTTPLGVITAIIIAILVSGLSIK